ncbi:hypothetical protein VFPPC_16723 [Pochonia chlamydosporia 170]|uniref:Uncharacterized protein n=1 Tax=Pochonia chlamydosporia 170 TaxID=1380566 RepID=A0A179F741_METCM|nr:hypothetical protein VFPPC_16723 [Pochonia chlamydosporia 170]OAQ61248.1 hypothetical protein VFPPC_16723 [Pochonia chlamydosporia 170]
MPSFRRTRALSIPTLKALEERMRASQPCRASPHLTDACTRLNSCCVFGLSQSRCQAVELSSCQAVNNRLSVSRPFSLFQANRRIHVVMTSEIGHVPIYSVHRT